MHWYPGSGESENSTCYVERIQDCEAGFDCQPGEQILTCCSRAFRGHPSVSKASSVLLSNSSILIDP